MVSGSIDSVTGQRKYVKVVNRTRQVGVSHGDSRYVDTTPIVMGSASVHNVNSLPHVPEHSIV